jgi:hypothetical protein
MVIPHSNPGKLLVRRDEILVRPVLPKASPVVIQREDLSLGNDSTLVDARDATFVLVDVVAQVDDVVNIVLAGDISVCVEVPIG